MHMPPKTAAWCERRASDRMWVAPLGPWWANARTPSGRPCKVLPSLLACLWLSRPAPYAALRPAPHPCPMPTPVSPHTDTTPTTTTLPFFILFSFRSGTWRRSWSGCAASATRSGRARARRGARRRSARPRRRRSSHGSRGSAVRTRSAGRRRKHSWRSGSRWAGAGQALSGRALGGALQVGSLLPRVWAGGACARGSGLCGCNQVAVMCIFSSHPSNVGGEACLVAVAGCRACMRRA